MVVVGGRKVSGGTPPRIAADGNVVQLVLQVGLRQLSLTGIELNGDVADAFLPCESSATGVPRSLVPKVWLLSMSWVFFSFFSRFVMLSASILSFTIETGSRGNLVQVAGYLVSGVPVMLGHAETPPSSGPLLKQIAGLRSGQYRSLGTKP